MKKILFLVIMFLMPFVAKADDSGTYENIDVCTYGTDTPISFTYSVQEDDTHPFGDVVSVVSNSTIVATPTDSESYIVISEDGKLATFYYDNQKNKRQGMVFVDGSYHNYASKVTKVVFDSSYADARPTSTFGWFDGMYNLTSIEGIEYLNTSQVTNMSEMFSNCSSLTNLDLSNFDTSKVTNMSGMFSGCSSLTNLDLSNFDTSKVTNMSWMFGFLPWGSSYRYSSLKRIDLSHFDTSNVRDMSGMFCGCSSLINLDLSHFDTSKVTDMSYMFGNCSSLISLDVSHFNTFNVSYYNEGESDNDWEYVGGMCYMFKGCSSLTSLDVSHFDTSNVKDMWGMFENCSSLTSIDVSNFDLSNIEYADNEELGLFSGICDMFYGCRSLINLNLFHLNTTNIISLNGLFSGCSSLISLDLSDFDTSSIQYMNGLFKDCSSLTNLDLSHFDTSNTKSMAEMFSGCSSLTYLDLSHFNTSHVYDDYISLFVDGVYYLAFGMRGLFKNCTSLKSLDVSHFDVTHVSDFSSMFEGCSSLESIKLFKAKMDYDQVFIVFNDVEYYNNFEEYIEYNEKYYNDYKYDCMFKDCGSLTSLDLSDFKMGIHVYSFEDDDDYVGNNSVSLLEGCHSLKDLSLPSSMAYAAENACDGVGSEQSPCQLTIPVGFDFDNVTPQGTFLWKRGWFAVEEGDKEKYLVLSENGKIGTFYYDSKWFTRTGMVFDLNGYEGLGADTAKVVTRVVFDPSFTEARPVSTYKWFYGMNNLLSIEGMEYLNTSEVTTMRAMFSNCNKLKNIDLSLFDTSKVTTMRNMFNGCSSLASLDVSKINTSNVTDMYRMFYGCSKIVSLDMDGFDTSNVTDMYSMFSNCSSLIALNVSGFNTSKVTNMCYMFNYCHALESIDVSSFNTSKVTDMQFMFNECNNLKSLDLSNFDMSKVTNTSAMFDNDYSLECLAISGTMDKLNDKACKGVGTEEKPCLIIAPKGFDFVVDTNGKFQWKAGWFTLASSCTLTVNAITLASGKDSNLILSLDNGDEKISAFQFDLTLPEGIALVEDGDGFVCTLTDRCSGMNVRVVKNQEHRYSLMAFFLNYDKYVAGTSGPVVTLTLKAEEGLSDGVLEGVVDNIVLTNLNYDVLKVAPVTFPITISKYPKGDVNHDGDVNVADVMMTVGEILGQTVSGFHMENADVNGDGSINITDVMGIVDIVLYHIPNSAPALATSDCISAVSVSGGVDLSLDKASRYTALEMTVGLPQGATLTRASLCKSTGHCVETHALGGGLHRVIVYSLSGEPLSETETLLHFDIVGGGDMKIGDIVLTNAFYEALSPQEATGVIDIAIGAKNAPTYNLQGMKVNQPKRGVYIQNNKKVVVE